MTKIISAVTTYPEYRHLLHCIFAFVRPMVHLYMCIRSYKALGRESNLGSRLGNDILLFYRCTLNAPHAVYEGRAECFLELLGNV